MNRVWMGTAVLLALSVMSACRGESTAPAGKVEGQAPPTASEPKTAAPVAPDVKASAPSKDDAQSGAPAETGAGPAGEGGKVVQADGGAAPPAAEAPVEPVEPEVWDPTPVESPTAPRAETAEVPAAPAPREVIPFPDGTDPFAALKAPVTPRLDESDPRSDVLRLGPEPPPEPGEVAAPFPPKVAEKAPPVVDMPPLAVVRFGPEKEIGLADSITATFNHPMVPLASLSQLQAADIPVTIEPPLEGRFVWVGTDTIALKVDDRLPFANQFTITVPAGVKSALGGVMKEPFSWTFQTPRPDLVSSSPWDGQNELGLDTTISLEFNAALDPAKVMLHLKLVDAAGTAVPLEVADMPRGAHGAGRVAETAEARLLARSMTVRPAIPLKPGTRYDLSIAPEMTCKEGPLPLGSRKVVTFRTYDPLEPKKVTCGWDDDECYLGSDITVEFNNNLKSVPVDAFFKVTPAVKGMTTRVSGSSVLLRGDFQASTRYEVQVLPGLADVHGQTSAKGLKGAVSFQDAWPILELVRQGVAVVEADQSHDFILTRQNLPNVELRLVQIPADRIAEAAEKAGGWFAWEDRPLQDIPPAVERPIPDKGEKNRIERIPIDLDQAFGGKKTGTVFVDVKARLPRGLLEGWDNYRQTALVQVTDLGLTAAQSEEALHVLVTRLSTGHAVEGANVRLFRRQEKRWLAEGTTDSSGVARLKGPRDLPEGEGPYLLVATLDSDLSFLPISSWGDVGSHVSSYSYTYGARHTRMAGLLYSDRGLYRPAEEVSFGVVTRGASPGPEGDVIPLPPGLQKIGWRVTDPRGNDAGTGEAVLSRFGTGAFKLSLPKDAPLGTYEVNVCGVFGNLDGTFDVQEYRTPEYEAGVEWLDEGSNVLVGRKLDARITGRYFFGAPMRDAAVSWTLTRSGSTYSPPGNPDFSFSDATTDSWFGWRSKGHLGKRGRRGGRHTEFGGGMVASGSGTLDLLGELVVPVTLDPGDIKGQPATFTLEAEVTDRNRQAVSARSTIIAHRAERYLGLSLDRSLVGQGEEVEVAAVVTRIDGSRYENAEVTAELLRIVEEEVPKVDEDGTQSFENRVREESVGRCTISSGKLAGTCRIKVPTAGSFVVRGLTRDLAGRPARAALRIWAWGDDMPSWSSRRERQVQLVADKKEYVPGETAHVLIQSPFREATGLLTVSREGFVRVEPVAVVNGNARLDLPILEPWMPTVLIRVALVSGRTQQPGTGFTDPGMPAFASGQASLSVARTPRRVTLDVKPSEEAVEPGGTVTVSVAASDWGGKPVEAGIALMVVDEGVLSLTGYSIPDVLAALYPPREDATCITDLRPRVVPRTAPELDLARRADARKDEKEELKKVDDEGGGLKGKSGLRAKKMKMVSQKTVIGVLGEDMGDLGSAFGGVTAAPEFDLRELFASTAFFDGGLATGPDGRLTVQVKLPDNLTRFRIMVVAADSGNRFGSGESAVTTRRPLVVRPALPRFLNFGDRFEAAAVVNNQTGFDTEVMVRCLADNAEVSEPTRLVPVKAGEAVEVRFAAAAGEPGPATFQFAAVALTSNRPTDAAQVIIPTLIPATGEAVAEYGVVDTAVRQPFVPPEDALPQFGGLDLALSSTALTGLQDAVSYLFDYPYECTEQLCSRLLPILALGDVIREFKLGKASTTDDAGKLVEEGFARILERQREDGGFGFWPDSRESWLYLSAYAVMTLDLARSKGYAVDGVAIDRGASFLAARLDGLYEWERQEYTGQAMAVLVLARLGRTPKTHLDRLVRMAQGKHSPMGSEGRAFLLEALTVGAGQKASAEPALDPRAADLLEKLKGTAVETAGAAHFAETRTESLRLIMHSDDRTDAVVLSALLRAAPNDLLVEKVVRGLVRSRMHGRWSSTQANAFALLALSRYFELFEKETPDFTARLWYAEKTVAASRFKGRTMDIVKTRVPMKALLEQAAGDLILAKKGPGRLYYRIGLKYAPRNLASKAADYGFSVERSFMPEGGPDRELRTREDGAFVVKAGSYVRVRLRVVAPDRRYYVAVVDPLAAGFEAVNEALKTSASQRLDGASGTTLQDDGERWWRRWYYNPWDYQELRDDRVQLFSDWMHEGVYEHTYIVRATTIGTFVVPPLRAEEMYSPDVFGRSDSAVVVVEP